MVGRGLPSGAFAMSALVPCRAAAARGAGQTGRCVPCSVLTRHRGCPASRVAGWQQASLDGVSPARCQAPPAQLAAPWTHASGRTTPRHQARARCRGTPLQGRRVGRVVWWRSAANTGMRPGHAQAFAAANTARPAHRPFAPRGAASATPAGPPMVFRQRQESARRKWVQARAQSCREQSLTGQRRGRRCLCSVWFTQLNNQHTLLKSSIHRCHEPLLCFVTSRPRALVVPVPHWACNRCSVIQPAPSHSSTAHQWTGAPA